MNEQEIKVAFYDLTRATKEALSVVYQDDQLSPGITMSMIGNDSLEYVSFQRHPTRGGKPIHLVRATRESMLSALLACADSWLETKSRDLCPEVAALCDLVEKLQADRNQEMVSETMLDKDPSQGEV